MTKTDSSKSEIVLGGYLRSMQGDPVRHGYMQLLVEMAAEARGEGGAIRILEIGSWAGGSAITWANGIDRFANRNGRVICVDPWREYLDLEVNDDLIYAEMEQALCEEQIYPLFQQNIIASGYRDIITDIRATSMEILPLLAKDSFDIIFVDGAHDYENVLRDLQLTAPLIRDGGFLCGDDLELQSGECADISRDNDHPIADFSVDANTGRGFHPGVTRAVAEFVGPVSSWSGFWAMRRAADDFVPIEIDETKVRIPDHLLETTDDAPLLLQPPKFLESVDGYNILETVDGILAISHEVGEIGALSNPLYSYDLPPVLIRDKSIGAVRKRIADHAKKTAAHIKSLEESIADKASLITAYQTAVANNENLIKQLEAKFDALEKRNSHLDMLQRNIEDKKD